MALFKKTPSNMMTVSHFDGIDCTKNVTSTISSAEYMRNFRITPAGKLKKRCGYKKLCTLSGASDFFVDGEIMFYRVMRTLYCVKLPDLTPIASYALSTSYKLVYFKFADGVYIISRNDMYLFKDNAFSIVAPYVPTIAVTAPETGGGTVFESLNMIINQAKISYSPSGSGAVFVLPDMASSIVEVTENGSVVDSEKYTFSSSTKQLTFSYTPAGGVADSLVVTFKFSTSQVPMMALLRDKKFCVYGGDFDSRVFVYGDRNIIYYSDITAQGADPAYFPAENYITVGDGTYDVTALVRHYSNLAVFTQGDAWYISPSSVDYDGYEKPTFPIYPLNSKIGCITGGGVLIDNYPFTINKQGAYLWKSTTVRDERNAVCLTDKISEALQSEFLSNAKVFDYEAKKEVWIYYDGIVWIYNYEIDSWYCFDGIYADRMFEYNGQILFCSNQDVFLFDENIYADDGKAYSAVWKSGFANFGTIDKKRLYRIYASLLPEGKSNVTVTLLTNSGERVLVGSNGEFSNNVVDFSAIDFSNFSFACGETGASVVRRRIRLRRFDSIRLILENSEADSRATVERVVLR